MTTHDKFIFGKEMFNDRFLTMVEILVVMVKLTQSAPAPVTLRHLMAATNRSPRLLTALCGDLQRTGLLQQDCFCPDKWSLNCDPTRVSLEDVFRCAFPAVESTPRSPGKASSGVELMVTNALIAIHQSFFKHLRDCSLHRVVISEAGMFPGKKRSLRDFVEDGSKCVSGFGLAADCPSPLPTRV
jgi:DNA-binding IscR family transcriptional regulator